ncbi:hypothetical protein Hanom_Chr02g00117331 [Helianthus anomalus]
MAHGWVAREHRRRWMQVLTSSNRKDEVYTDRGAPFKGLGGASDPASISVSSVIFSISCSDFLNYIGLPLPVFRLVM